MDPAIVTVIMFPVEFNSFYVLRIASSLGPLPWSECLLDNSLVLWYFRHQRKSREELTPWREQKRDNNMQLLA